MKTINNLEFRCINEKFELVQWLNNKEYCIAIALFNKTLEGYDIQFVGRRPFETGFGETVWAMLKYGQAIVDAEWELDNG